MRIIDAQEKLRDDLARLERVVSYIAKDELSSKYLARLSKIERGLSRNNTKFKNRGDVRKFFRTF